MKNRFDSGKACLAWLLLFAAAPCSPAVAQKWATDMFDHTSHDFGVVARGAKAEHRFKIENIYVEDAHIKSVKSSCGCTTPVATKDRLKSWDTSDIVVAIDTRGHLGRKDATITVVFDQPFAAEVQLQVHCNIRGDVVVQPGLIDFGSVPQGAGAQQRAAIVYAGRADWKILRVESANSSLSAQAVEKARIPGPATRVEYDLLATLKADAAAGSLHAEVFLVTNDADPQKARVPVPVEAAIQPTIAVHPSPLLMGSVAPGESITRQLIVHGNKPFRLVQVESTDKRFRCQPPEGVAAMHRLPVTFVAAAGEPAGQPSAKIRIKTDSQPGAPLEVAVSVQVTSDIAPPAAPVKPATP